MGKRKFCSDCNEEFSERYFRRHTCHQTPNLQHTQSFTEKHCHQVDNYETVDTDCSSENNDIYEYCRSEKSSSEPDDLNFKEEISELDESDSEDGDIEELVFDDIDYSDLWDENADSEANIASAPMEMSCLKYIVRTLLAWKSRFYISDTAFSFILLIMKTLLYLTCGTSEFAESLYQNFPKNLYQLNKLMSYSKNNFQKFVVCPKCCSLYNYSDCFEIIEGVKRTKKCVHVSFPRHPQRHFRRPCGENLLKLVSIGGSEQLIARKMYCYKDIEESLQNYVLREDFEKKCESWRNRNVARNVMMGVYDGEIWKEFQEKHDFLSQERNYALMLNVDWFQPFKHTNYSVGALYVVFLNLPREERFKRENVILIGLIPDMKSEPPTNTFLEPFVEKMKEAWDGLYMKSFSSSTPVKFRLALLCVGCDVPASRKLCGFLGHGATMGCNKCMKAFPGCIGEKLYGGFDIRHWEKRTLDAHRDFVSKVVKGKTKGEKEEHERKYGVRYSVLLELKYFDPIRMTIIDPMHNLFLGTAKRVMNLWIQTGILDKCCLQRIEEKVDKIVCPSDVGRLPQKLSSSHGSFNADQWKNWSIIFSVYALKDVIPDNHLDYWRKFVIACKVLCSKAVTKESVKVAHLMLLHFCERLENTFSENVVTPNMHLHGHLDQCLYDYGPVYSFWLFSFERENGILGSIPTNQKLIEAQLMENFVKDKDMCTFDNTCDRTIVQDIGQYYTKLRTLYDAKERGTLNKINNQSDCDLIHMSSRAFDIATGCWTLDLSSQVQTSSLKNCVLDEQHIALLTKMYNVLYPNEPDSSLIVCRTCRTSKSITLCGSLLGCKQSRSARSSMIVAYWHEKDGNISCFDNMDLVPRPGQIQRLIVHNAVLDGVSKVHVLAHVKWFKCCSENLKIYYGKPVEVWYKDLFEQEGPASFIPVQRIRSKFVYAYDTLNGKNVIIVIPRERITT